MMGGGPGRRDRKTKANQISAAGGAEGGSEGGSEGGRERPVCTVQERLRSAVHADPADRPPPSRPDSGARTERGQLTIPDHPRPAPAGRHPTCRERTRQTAAVCAAAGRPGWLPPKSGARPESFGHFVLVCRVFFLRPHLGFVGGGAF